MVIVRVSFSSRAYTSIYDHRINEIVSDAAVKLYFLLLVSPSHALSEVRAVHLKILAFRSIQACHLSMPSRPLPLRNS